MLNIPTDLLRTLVTVVELRSFTKAAKGLGVTQPAVSAQIKRRHQWMRQAVWVRGDALRLDPSRPVPLVAYGEDCACQRVAVQALRDAGRECEFVFSSRSLVSLVAAVAAGFGVMVMPRGRA